MSNQRWTHPKIIGDAWDAWDIADFKGLPPSHLGFCRVGQAGQHPKARRPLRPQESYKQRGRKSYVKSMTSPPSPLSHARNSEAGHEQE